MIAGLFLVIVFLIWRRRRQQQKQQQHQILDDNYDRSMTEAEIGRGSHRRMRSSPFSPVTPDPLSRGNSSHSKPHSHLPTTPEPVSGAFADDASLISYNAATGPGVYSPLDTPDPFRSTFHGQVPFLNISENPSSSSPPPPPPR